MPEDLVVRLEPHGKPVPIPKNAKATVHNDTDQQGQVTWKLNPPPVTQGIVEVPAKQTRPIPPLGETGGTVQNTGHVALTLNIQTVP